MKRKQNDLKCYYSTYATTSLLKCIGVSPDQKNMLIIWDRYLFGGTVDGVHGLNDLWAFDYGAYPHPHSHHHPRPHLHSHFTFTSPLLNLTVSLTSPSPRLHPLYLLSTKATSTWTQLPSNGTIPAPRFGTHLHMVSPTQLLLLSMFILSYNPFFLAHVLWKPALISFSRASVLPSL